MFTKTPLVSVVLPVYNEVPEFLEKAIVTIQSQTIDDFEIIIVDDGSILEKTIELLHHYQRSDSKIKLKRTPNKGASAARNVGISLSRGKYICMHDSDDWSERERIENQIDFLEKNKSISILGTNAILHQSNETELWHSCLPLTNKDIMEFLNNHCSSPFFHGSICFQKEHAVAIGGYREGYFVAEDGDFCWRLCHLSEGANLSDNLYHYRFKAGSLMSKKKTMDLVGALLFGELAKMRENGLPENWELAKETANKMLHGKDLEHLSLLKRADHTMLSGSYAAALSMYLEAIRKRPADRISYLKLVRFFIFLIFPTIRKKLFETFNN